MRYVHFLAFTLIAAALAAQNAPAKIGVIDVERVISESAAGKEAFLKLKKLQDRKVEEAKKFEEDLMAMEKQLGEQRFILSDEKLKELQKVYEDKQISYKRFKDDTERGLKTARDEELKKLEEKIFPIINKVGKDQGYVLLFNKFNSGLVYADEAVDITDEILRQFNTQVNLPAPSKKSDTAPPEKK
jgi:outer membrane protein